MASLPGARLGTAGEKLGTAAQEVSHQRFRGLGQARKSNHAVNDTPQAAIGADQLVALPVAGLANPAAVCACKPARTPPRMAAYNGEATVGAQGEIHLLMLDLRTKVCSFSETVHSNKLRSLSLYLVCLCLWILSLSLLCL